MLDIYQYSDYREFMKDTYLAYKTRNSAFSYRYFAGKAGINSSSFFKYVIEGKTNLTKNTVLRVCQALKLKDEHAEYFENLVFFNQARSTKEKSHYFDILTRLRNVSDRKQVGENEYDFYAEWYHSVIRELVTFIDFKDDFAMLAKNVSPPITARQAQDSLNLLVRLGFLKKKGKGKYIQSDPVISSGHDIKAYQVINFQVKMLKMALGAFDRFPVHERMMSTVTCSISRETYELFKKKSREYRSQLLELARMDEHPDRVYQLTLNLFPMSPRGIKK